MRRNEKKIEGNACASDLFSSICLLYKLDIFWFGRFILVQFSFFFYISIYFGLRNSIRKSPALLIYGEIYKNEIRSNQLLKKYFVFFFILLYQNETHMCARVLDFNSRKNEIFLLFFNFIYSIFQDREKMHYIYLCIESLSQI